MSRRKPRYTGELANPIKWNGPLTREIISFVSVPEAIQRKNQAAWDRANLDAQKQIVEKLRLLRCHYGIDDDDPQTWPLLLALELARDWVRGFQIDFGRTRPGPKEVWNPLTYTQLVADVEAVKRARRCGDRQACRILVLDRRGRYARRKGQLVEKAALTLKSRLVEARNPARNLFARLFQKRVDQRPNRIVPSLR